ncbi:MAG: hypothetical protein ITG02_02365, partial [Patulibacter sp.]|nr:hypothetical protein [Patulibacter sp.]
SPSIQTATARVRPDDAGVASAATTAMHQLGAAVGTALLSTIVAAVTARQLEPYGGAEVGPAVLAAADLRGFTVAFWIASAVFVVGAAIVWSLIRPTTVQRSGGHAGELPARDVEDLAVYEVGPR